MDNEQIPVPNSDLAIQITLDPATYIFGSSEDYDDFMVAYLEGDAHEVSDPQPGDIALFIDAGTNVIFLGLVVDKTEDMPIPGQYVVESKDLGSPFTIFSPLDVAPVDDVDIIEFVTRTR